MEPARSTPLAAQPGGLIQGINEFFSRLRNAQKFQDRLQHHRVQVARLFKFLAEPDGLDLTPVAN